jgi:hypothetical protein
VGRNRWIDNKEEQRAQSNALAKNFSERNGEANKKQPIQNVHRDTRAPLDGIGIVLAEDGTLRKLTLTGLSLNWRSGPN